MKKISTALIALEVRSLHHIILSGIIRFEPHTIQSVRLVRRHLVDVRSGFPSVYCLRKHSLHNCCSNL